MLVRLIQRAELDNGYAHSTFNYIEMMLKGALAKQKEDSKTIFGAGDKTRTYDLMITNQLLYQLSYTGLCDPQLGDPQTRILAKSSVCVQILEVERIVEQ